MRQRINYTVRGSSHTWRAIAYSNDSAEFSRNGESYMKTAGSAGVLWTTNDRITSVLPEVYDWENNFNESDFISYLNGEGIYPNGGFTHMYENN